MEIQHTAVRVSNLEATKAFHQDGLGLDHTRDFHTDDGVHNYYVTSDELDTEIRFVHDPDADGDVSPDGIAPSRFSWTMSTRRSNASSSGPTARF